MTNIVALRAANAQRWARMHIHADREYAFEQAGMRLVAPAAKARYQCVSADTGVPWAVIALIHERECSQDWTRSLAQGDRWDRVSVHVPTGRGPFRSWEDAAVDALVNCSPNLARSSDWSIGTTLTRLEQYNGLGYAARGLPSPYLWSGTDQYSAGKYVRDGVYDPNAIDSQLGCAGLLRAMIALDVTAGAFDASTVGVGVQPPVKRSSLSPPVKSPPPSISNPSKGSIGAVVASLFAAIFRRK